MNKQFFYCVMNLKKLIIYTLAVVVLTAFMVASSYYTSQIIETNSSSRLLPIYSVETSDKKVAITFDVAWSQSR